MSNNEDYPRVNRRSLLKLAGIGGLVTATAIGIKLLPASREVESTIDENITADRAWELLKVGNQRYIDRKAFHPHQTGQRMVALAKGQHPFAIILGCADSRVPPEIIFDQGLGDLFVIRVAGNIVDDAIAGSIEYAVEELKVPLLVVLGHERCGAVTAAVKGGEVPGHISSLVNAIKPAVKSVQGLPGDIVENSVKANIKIVVSKLKSTQPIVSELVKSNKIKIVGGRYDLDTGKVDLIA
ncbi:carbonic anhydrase [[Phormidium ambiguum] IAM M-71]|uniref:Carbonic anhydrase n=1 Tax=[Phormidium ambiguum] IAM M-71 TaxID=454136 RepID=A0A1U7I7U5_9CYAN|nr:carbonic anhydrase [Phormidium ambiguum]OKH32468.1 carbonic anhydrase [Phormidium ambiguum IAM M-71]